MNKKKYKYNNGDILGPYSMLLLKRLPKKDVQYKGLFKCAYCENTFVANISDVARGKRKSCGCQDFHKMNLVGKQFGRLVVLRKALPKEIHKKTQGVYWYCKCECGNFTVVRTTQLVNGKTKSCGCLAREQSAKRNRINLIGQKFYKLTVIEDTGKRNSKQGIIYKCQCECGNFKDVSTQHLKNGNVTCCDKCSLSKGEFLIGQILDTLNIKYIREYTFMNCINPKTNHSLRFDFYLSDYNCCIEYDGEQHFKYSNNGWATEEKYNQTKYRDNLKNKYCADNNIKLIRIPYTDFSKLNTDYLINLL